MTSMDTAQLRRQLAEKRDEEAAGARRLDAEASRLESQANGCRAAAAMRRANAKRHQRELEEMTEGEEGDEH